MQPLKSNVAAVLSLSCWLLMVAGARAQQRGFALDQFNPAERGSDWFAADSLDLRGKLRPIIGVVGSWSFRPLVARNSADDYERAIVRNQFVLHPGVSVIIRDRVRLAIDVPVQAYADGRAVTVGDTTFAAPDNKSSLGDLHLAADVRLWGVYGDPFQLAIGVQVALPTGDRDSYSGDGATRVTPQLLAAGDIGTFVYAARLGVGIRPEDRAFGESYTGSYLGMALAAGMRVIDRKLVFGPELLMQSVLTKQQFLDQDSTPLEVLLGLHYSVVPGLRVGAGFGVGITASYSSPQRRGLLSIDWGAPVAKPAPITVPDALPADRDLDGVPDGEDACPDHAGEATRRGCPAPRDRDGDGVRDDVDACPDRAGAESGDELQNGCPPPDRDRDGILDAQDACPDQSGDPDPDPKRNGCPKAFVEGSQIKILDQVKFEKNRADILPGLESETVLLAVLKVLQEQPGVRSVRIEGHTDSTGSARRNRELSQQRAISVRAWLVARGVEAIRLSSAGFGPDRPIDSNETEQGRQSNRRVEFQIESSPTSQ
jgi:OmpA-OmpF porin, OOP family